MSSKSIITTASLISNDASTAIKGLLMLLIIFGHSGMLTTDFATGERTFFWQWLYNFHVYMFMILPFIYGYKYSEGKENEILEKRGKWYVDIQRLKRDIKYNLIKIGVPYCWIFVFSAIIFVTVGGGSFNLKGMLYAFFFGNQSLMDKYIGFNFVWFLPAMLALTVMKSLWYNSSRAVRYCMLATSTVLWLLAIFRVLPQNTAGMYVPFSLSQAFYYLLLGLTARWLVEKTAIKKALPWIVVIIVAITSMMYCQRKMDWPPVISYTAFYRLVLPVLVFLLLYGISGCLSKSRLLSIIGKYSFQVYLVHVYVINILQMIVLRFFPQSIGLGIAIYVLTLAISLGVAIVMVKVTVINKVLFPKG